MVDYAQKLNVGGVTRRQFLGVSVLGSAALYAGSGLAAMTLSHNAQAAATGSAVLRAVDVDYFAAVLPAVIVQADSAAARASFVSSLERMLTPASAHSLGAIQDLVDLLTGSLTRPIMTLSWSDWSAMPTAQVTQVLADWQHSSIGLKRTAYGLTTSLVRTAWYMQADAQTVSGYPGSPKKIVEGVS